MLGTHEEVDGEGSLQGYNIVRVGVSLWTFHFLWHSCSIAYSGFQGVDRYRDVTCVASVCVGEESVAYA